MIFSYSRLSTFKCPAAFYKKYVLKTPMIPTEPLVLGKSCHAGIETLLKHKNSSEEFMRIVSSAIAGACDLSEDELFRLINHPEVLRTVDGLTDTSIIEDYFKMPITGDPVSPEIQGYIDLWSAKDDEIVLTDWKSNRVMYNPTENHQLGLYAGYLKEKTGLPVRGRLVFLRFPKVGVVEHEYTDEDITAAQSWALETANEINKRLFNVQHRDGKVSENFPVKPGDTCQYCPSAHACVKDKVYEIDSITDAEEQGREILRLEGALTLLKTALKGYVQEAGPVQVDLKEFAMVHSQYWKWPQDSLTRAVKVMEEEGVDPLTILSLTKTGLKKLRWDDIKIASLGADTKESLSFKHRRKSV